MRCVGRVFFPLREWERALDRSAGLHGELEEIDGGLGVHALLERGVEDLLHRKHGGLGLVRARLGIDEHGAHQGQFLVPKRLAALGFDHLRAGRGAGTRGESNGEVSGWDPATANARARIYRVRTPSRGNRARVRIERAGTEVRGSRGGAGVRGGLARVPSWWPPYYRASTAPGAPWCRGAGCRRCAPAPRTADAAGGGAVRGRQRRGGRGTSRRRRARHASGVSRGARSRVATRTWYLSAFHPATERSTPPNTMASRGEAPAPRDSRLDARDERRPTGSTMRGRGYHRLLPHVASGNKPRSAVGSSTVRARLAMCPRRVRGSNTPPDSDVGTETPAKKPDDDPCRVCGTQSGVANFGGTTISR